MSKIPNSQYSMNYDNRREEDGSDEYKSKLLDILMNPDRKQLMSLAILRNGPGVFRLALSLTLDEAMNPGRYIYDEDTGYLKQHISLRGLFNENMMLLSRSLGGKLVDHTTVLAQTEAEAEADKNYYGRG